MLVSAALVWFFVGVAFLVAEWLLPGFILVFFGAGSWLVAITLWLTDMGINSQIVLFLASSLTFLFVLRRILVRTFHGETREDQGDDYVSANIGQAAEVIQAITPPSPGRVKCMGSFWPAIANQPVAVGSTVIIEGSAASDGLTLKVRPLSPSPSE